MLSLPPLPWAGFTKKVGLLALAAVLLLLALIAPHLPAGPPGPLPSFETVRIGLVAPLSGSDFSEGARWLYAARQAVSTWNAEAGAMSYRVELVAYDEAEGPAVARRLALDPDVVAVVGYWRPPTSPEAIRDFQEARLPLLAVGAPDRPLSEVDTSYVLRLTPSQTALAQAAGRFVAQRLKGSRVAMVAGPAVQDLVTAELFREGAAAAGLRTVRAEAVAPFSSDYSALLRRLANAEPQVVFFGGSSADAQSFLGQFSLYSGWREPPAVVLAPLAGGPDVLREIRGASGAVYWVSAGGDPQVTTAGRRFVETYRQRWRTSPSPLAGVVYDATGLVLQSLESARARPKGERRQAVWELLEKGFTYHGIAGQYVFNERRGLLTPKGYVFRLDEGDFPGTLVGEVDVGPDALAPPPGRP